MREPLTEMEKSYIERMSGTMSCVDIGKNISRDGSVVSRYIKRKGLQEYGKQNGGRHPLEQTDYDLQEKIERTAHLSIEDARKTLGMGLSTLIKYRRKYLGVCSYNKKNECLLTDADKEFIRANYKTMTNRELAEKSESATYFSVRNFLRREGLSRKDKKE